MTGPDSVAVPDREGAGGAPSPPIHDANTAITWGSVERIDDLFADAVKPQPDPKPKYRASAWEKGQSGNPTGKRPPKGTRERYLQMRAAGIPQNNAVTQLQISKSQAKKYEQSWEAAGGAELDPNKPRQPQLGPIPYDNLKLRAKKGLASFELFQRTYLGRIAVPWQAEMAELVVKLEATPRDEYVVVNVAPGSGKSSTLIAIVCWLIAKKREIRVLWGSYSQNQAEWYTRQIRDILSTTVPIKAKPIDLKLGTAVDAVATMSEDFGTFKGDEMIWRNDQFSVVQFAGNVGRNKEATVQAFGMDSSFIGGRFDVVLWDDVYDAKKLASWDAKEKQRAWWLNTAETRLDMGGLLVNQMQRLDPEDISKFCKDMYEGDDEFSSIELVDHPSDNPDDEGEEPDDAHDGTERKKYKHIVYPAHFEDRCKGDHGSDAKPYPTGCLLYPKNLPWRKIAQQQRNNPNFRLVYQQEDVDPANVLIEPVWVSGGVDAEGVECPGCWDGQRALRQVPTAVNPWTAVSFVTVDPSPSNFWAVQWWLYDGQSKFMYLIDLLKERMEAPKFLDWHHNAGQFTGIMPEWVEYSQRVGIKITHMVIEQNAAQKFMYQYDHMQRFARQFNVGIVPHTTNQNKHDPQLGVPMLQPEFRFGRIRLPGAQDGRSRLQSLKLIEEVTRYQLDKADKRGGLATDDQLMACWFARLATTKLYRTNKVLMKDARPTWMMPVEGVG